MQNLCLCFVFWGMKRHNIKPTAVITDPQVEQYAEEHSSAESPEIRKLIESSAKALQYLDMLSGNMVGQLLQLLIKISDAKNVLEVGTFTGYSAISMAEALPEDGKVVTLEYKTKFANLAKKHFEKSEVGHKIELVVGNARKTILKLEEKFDFAYIDADKHSYSLYYDAVIERLKPNGIIVVDNVLWEAAVLNPDDDKAKAIDDFNKKIKADERVQKILLPIRDGVTIIRKL